MFSNISVMKIVVLLCFVAAATASPIFFGHGKHEHIVVHVPYNVHTHNIHHHHIQAVPVYKPVPIIKHVPVHVVKEVAIPVHLSSYKEGWNNPEPQWW